MLRSKFSLCIPCSFLSCFALIFVHSFIHSFIHTFKSKYVIFREMKLLLIIDKFHSLLHSEYSHINLDISPLILFHCCVCVIIQFSWFLHLSIRKFVFLNFSHPFRFSYNCNFRAAAFAPGPPWQPALPGGEKEASTMWGFYWSGWQGSRS